MTTLAQPLATLEAASPVIVAAPDAATPQPQLERWPIAPTIMARAYTRLENARWESATFYDLFTPLEREIVMVGNLNYQVENGGFLQWFENGYGAPALKNDLLAVIDAIGTPAAIAVHGLVTQAQAAYHTYEEEKAPSRWHAEDAEDAWQLFVSDLEPLDSRYYKVNEACMLDFEAHLRGRDDVNAYCREHALAV